jgi:hypothetical protein
LKLTESVVLYLSTNDFMWDDGNKLGPVEIHNYLNRVMYQRRNKFDPLWNSLVLGGVKNGQKYLGVVCFAPPLGTRFDKFMFLQNDQGMPVHWANILNLNLSLFYDVHDV